MSFSGCKLDEVLPLIYMLCTVCSLMSYISIALLPLMIGIHGSARFAISATSGKTHQLAVAVDVGCKAIYKLYLNGASIYDVHTGGGGGY